MTKIIIRYPYILPRYLSQTFENCGQPCKICLAVSSRDTKGQRNSTVFSHKRVNTIGLIIPYSVYVIRFTALIKLPNYLLDVASRCISSVKVKSPTERIHRKARQPFHFAVCAHARNCVVKANLHGSFSARCEMNASSERVLIRTPSEVDCPAEFHKFP